MISVLVRKKLIDLFSKSSYVFCKSRNAFSTSTNNQPSKTTAALEFLLETHDFSPETVSRVTSALTNLKSLENSESVLSFLKESGFSKPQLEKILKSRPDCLSCSLENTIKPKFKILQGLGCSDNELMELITKDPWILHRGSKTITNAISVLRDLLGSDSEVVKLLVISPWFLSKNLEKSLMPNIEFLKSCGIPSMPIIRLIHNFPRALLRYPDMIRRGVHKADEMGVSRSSKMFIHAFRVALSMNDKTWKMKLQALRNLGFSESDIVRTFRQAPPVFSISTEKMMKVKEVVLASGKYNVSCIVNAPTSLCCSIEKRYKPRLQVLAILESKNLITKWPSFRTLFLLTDEMFFEKYVAPYSDKVGDVCTRKPAVPR